MKVLQGFTVCLAVCCMLGCADPPPPSKTVFDPLTQQLDRARDVQTTVDQNTAATRTAVDSEERGDPQQPAGAEQRDTQDAAASRP
jgi:hypothetical protein